MPNYWMLVTTPENYRTTKEQGLTLQGFRARHRRKTQRMLPKDRLLYYLRYDRKFAATATIISPFTEDHRPLWKDANPQEDFPYRVRIQPNAVLEEKEFLEARQLGPTLHYVRRWIPEEWYLAFQEDLHLLPQRDFFLIEGEMHRVMDKRSRAPARR
ncbi:MAG: EVE domain-containing protein [Dehalococcoidia bacterium]|nr:EVE domain-containing protein [Dehalococcoidia bacterium]